MRIAIVEDDKLLRETLNILLSGDGGFEVVGVFGSGEEGIDALDKARPELMLNLSASNVAR